MEPVFVERKVVGQLFNGVFVQRVTDRHIFRQYNAKGIDVDLHHRLKPLCHTWRLVFKDTKRIISIPFEKIEKVGLRYGTGAGQQFLVGLDEFAEEQPALQPRLV